MTTTTKTKHAEAEPITGQRSRESQAFGTLTRYPLGLTDETRRIAVEGLNQLLVESIVLRDMYKKHHWQVSGPTFYVLHQLFDRHANEQSELIDALAERVQMLGGVAVALAGDVSAMSKMAPARRGREEVPVQLSRLLESHEHILIQARALAHEVARLGDDGTNDVLVSEIVRTHERQVWFVSEHLVDTPLVHARD